MELLERFEAATEGGPEHLPIASRLTDGRRAVRRRRLTIGAAALSTLVIMGTGWAMVPGDSVRGAEVTGTTAASSTTEVEEVCPLHHVTGCAKLGVLPSKDVAGRPLVHPDAPFAGFVNGELAAAPGVTIVDSISSPDVKGYARPGEQTAAVTITWAGETWFVLTSDGTLGHTVALKSPDLPTLEAFLSRQEQLG